MLEDVILAEGGIEVHGLDVYHDVFRLGEGMIEKAGEDSGTKGNPIGYWRNHDEDTGHFRVLLDDTFSDTLKEMQKADFAVLNGLTYFGRRNKQENASTMCAMIFDIDGLTDSNLRNFFSGARSIWYPMPNYVILSGHGVHLYYVFDSPIKLYPYTKFQLKNFKYALIRKMWNPNTSKIDSPQYQGINQGFRVIGGKTKIKGIRVKAFKIHDKKYTIEQLQKYVPEEERIDMTKLFKESKYTLSDAKKKFPEWYKRVIEGKGYRTRWQIEEKVNGSNPYALYDWWLRKIIEQATYGHRYFCIMCLVIYGIKCNVPKEKVKADAMNLVQAFNNIKPEFPFTKEDVLSALDCYDLRYCTFPIRDIEKVSGTTIKRNKRNGRKQKIHMATMRAIQGIIDPEGKWREGNGRKPKKAIVEAWQKANPKGKKIDCIKDTGLSKPTVYKWWKDKEEGYTR